MKVRIQGYEALRIPLELEGDTIVKKGEDLFLDEGAEGPIPTVAANALGFTFFEGEEAFTITKRYSSTWLHQIYISFPLPTLMNDDLGRKIEAGRVGRYIHNTQYEPLFSMLSPLLTEMNYNGFISMRFNKENNLIEILFGAGLSLYAILEGVRGKISDFFSVSEAVLESWSVSLVLSRYPYPFKDESDRLFLKISSDAKKHLWFFGLNSYRKSFYTDLTKICIVSSWATSANESARRVYRTCQDLVIPQKQYRTDVANVASTKWVEYISSNSKD